MKRAGCPREGDVLKAGRSGMSEEALRAHAAECSVCAEIVQVSQWMQTLAESPERADALPDAGLMWWRAQLSEKQAKMDRAQNILGWAEFIFATLLLAGLVGWLIWNWNLIQTRLTSISAGVQQQLLTTMSSVAGATPFLSSAGVVILSLVVVGLVYPLLARD